MKITLATIDACCGKAHRLCLDLPEGSTVRDGLIAAGVQSEPESVAIFCRKVTLDSPLSEGDRIDVGTPLRVERSEVRRLREAGNRKSHPWLYARHGSKRQLQNR